MRRSAADDLPASEGPRGQPRDDVPFAAAVLASHTALSITDPRRHDNPITFVNAAWERITGFSRAESLGRNCRFLQGPGTNREDAARIARALAAGEGIEVDLLNYRKDGTPFWNAMAINPVRGQDGTLVAFVGSQQDVTARHAAEADLRGTQHRLEQEVARRTEELSTALAQQTALLHEVDHRVKNSLQMISSLMLLKTRRVREPHARAVLQSMSERVGALTAVHRLLYAVGDVSRFDLGAFATEFAADLAVMTDAARVRIDVDAAPLPVSASKAAPLAILVHELATNAIRHAFPDGRSGRVSIGVRRRDDAVALTVVDDGVGLAATAPNPDGFGRNLIDMVVRQMRGQLEFEDARPGTRADVTIPLDAGEGAP